MPPQIRFQQIDVLRGLAALTVVFSHIIPYWNRYLGDVWVIVPGAFGYYAVNLFFIISGMVIFMTLDKCNSVAEFALLRFSRLYPAYWTTLLLSTLIGVVIFGNAFWLGGFVVNGTMFQEFLGYGNLDNVYWSLTVELAFYLNAAWLFALGFHKKILTVVSVWLCLSGVWAITDVDHGGTVRDWISLLMALEYAPYFVIGILFYHGRGRRWRLSEFGLLAASLAVEYLIASWEGLAVAVASSLLVLAATLGLLRVFTCRFTLWLGTISYSLYLIHRNIAYNMLPWLHGHGLGPVTGLTITTLVVVGLAAGVTYWVERPASRMIRARLKNRSRPKKV